MGEEAETDDLYILMMRIHPIKEAGRVLRQFQANTFPEDKLSISGYTLFPHQVDAVKMLTRYQKGMLVHSPGSGKTITILAILVILKDRGVVSQGTILSPAKVAPMWEEKINEFGLNFRVISFNRMHRLHPEAIGDALVVDEAHWVKGRKTWHAHALHLVQNIQHTFLLTATPFFADADLLYIAEYLHIPLWHTSVIKHRRKIVGIHPESLYRISRYVHVYMNPDLISRIKSENWVLGTTEDAVDYFMKGGKRVLVYVSTVARGEELKSKFPHSQLIAKHYSPPSNAFPITIMTHQMGEGVNLTGIADVIIYDTLPHTFGEYFQTAFRFIRISGAVDTHIYIRHTGENQKRYLKFHSQRRFFENAFVKKRMALPITV